MTNTQTTFARYSAIRDEIEAAAAAATVALRQAERLDLDASDHLAVNEKLRLAEQYLAAIRAA